jgi:hypothetical protein
MMAVPSARLLRVILWGFGSIAAGCGSSASRQASRERSGQDRYSKVNFYLKIKKT